MLKQITETNNKINANAVGADSISAPKETMINKSIANAVGVAPLGDPQTKNSSKEYLNLTSHFTPLTSQNGITLIALIITIIIMLILVTVTITVALKGELFSTAKQAKTETGNKINEEQNLASENIEIEGERYNSIGDYVNDIKIPTENDYGKYIEYGIDLNGDGNKTNDWKVFYVDGKGHTFIIAADYVSEDKCSAFQTATKNSKMIRNTGNYKYCYYWDYNTEILYNCYDKHNASNQTKKQCSFPDLFMATKYYYSDHLGTYLSGMNTRCVITLMCTDNWKDFVDKSYGATYAIGGPTLEMWVASWNKKHGQDVDTEHGITLYANGNNNSGNGYYVGTTSSAKTESYSLSNSDGYNDTLYFPHKSDSNDLDGDGIIEKCSDYWLASPSAHSASFMFKVSCNGDVGYGDLYGHSIGLRPIVCIESAVKLIK